MRQRSGLEHHQGPTVLYALKQSAQKQQRINPERHKSDLEHLLYAFRSEGVILEHPRSHRRIHILICGHIQDMDSC